MGIWKYIIMVIERYGNKEKQFGDVVGTAAEAVEGLTHTYI